MTELDDRRMTLNPEAAAMLLLLAGRGGTPVEDATTAEVRADTWQWLDHMGDPEPMGSVEDTYITGPSAELHVRVYTPSTGSSPRPGLVFFHGGGWTAGNIELSDRPNRSIANATGCVLVAVNYQKAPEHRYPTALDDCYAAWQWVGSRAAALGIDPAAIGVGGDSAGGNLAAAVCLRARDADIPPPAFQVLIYPALDPTLSSRSARTRATGYGLTTAAMRRFWDNYAPTAAQRADPLAAPLVSSTLTGLPPAVVVTAGLDPLRDEGTAYADRLEAAEVPVTRHDYPSTIHGFLWMKTALVDDFTRLMTDLHDDVTQLTAGPTPPGTRSAGT